MNPDRNYPPGDFADKHNELHGPLLLAPSDEGAGFSDVFKVSCCTGCTWEEVTVAAGRQRENALDLNRNSRGNRFGRLVLDAGGMNAVLIKGGSSANDFPDVLINRVGGHSDLYLGDYSNQSKAKTTGNRFGHWRRLDGRPVRVAWNLVRAEKPVFTATPIGGIRYQWGLSLLRTLYVELKYLFPKLIP